MIICNHIERVTQMCVSLMEFEVHHRLCVTVVLVGLCRNVQMSQPPAGGRSV